MKSVTFESLSRYAVAAVMAHAGMAQAKLCGISLQWTKLRQLKKAGDKQLANTAVPVCRRELRSSTNATFHDVNLLGGYRQCANRPEAFYDYGGNGLRGCKSVWANLRTAGADVVIWNTATG